MVILSLLLSFNDPDGPAKSSSGITENLTENFEASFFK